jgi:hypothetical protein
MARAAMSANPDRGFGPELWELSDTSGEIAVAIRIPRTVNRERQRRGICGALESRDGWRFARPAVA